MKFKVGDIVICEDNKRSSGIVLNYLTKGKKYKVEKVFDSPDGGIETYVKIIGDNGEIRRCYQSRFKLASSTPLTETGWLDQIQLNFKHG